MSDCQVGDEAHSVHSKQVVRQCRRLQALIRCVGKYHRVEPTPALCEQIVAIQNQVLSACGFGVSYSNWSGAQDLASITGEIPSVEVLQQHFAAVDTFAKQALSRQRSACHEDWKHRLQKPFRDQGGKLAFQHIQSEFTPEVAQVTVVEKPALVSRRCRSKCKPVLQLQQPVNPMSRVTCKGKTLELHQDRRTMSLRPGQEVNKAHIYLETWLSHPEDIHREFFRFWDQFWNPTAALGDQELPDIVDFGGSFPIDLDPRVTSAEVRITLARTRSNTSVGSDGWCLCDLKWCLMRNFLNFL